MLALHIVSSALNGTAVSAPGKECVRMLGLRLRTQGIAFQTEDAMHTSKIPLDRHIGFHLLVIGWMLLVLATSFEIRQARGQCKDGRLRSNTAEDCDELHREYEKVFPGATLSEVASWQRGADAGIALRASWELIRRSMKRVAPQPGPVGTLDRLKVERFIGFVEGRLRIQVPEWWSELLRRGSYYSGQSLWLDMTRASAPYAKTDSGIFAPAGTRVVYEGADLRVTRDSESMVIPATVLATAKEQLGDLWGINVLFLDRFRRLVAIWGDGFGAYPLFMLDTDSARPVWQASVWGDIPRAIGGGGLIHWVGLYCAGDMILVVGATDYAAYVQGFSTTNGSNLFRFSTSY